MRIAIIGSGISGGLVARILSSRHDVMVFETNDYAGGHANTVDVVVGGKSFAVDTGFMVFNRRTYPNFSRLLDMLEVSSQPSEMSFSVRCAKTGLEYQGSSLSGLFAQRQNVLSPSFWGMLWDIARFNRCGTAVASSGELRAGRTVGDFLQQCGVGRRFVEHYLVPMAAAIWSSRPGDIREFPAEFMIGFFANHGLLQLRNRPAWRTIGGGSRNYVAALLKPLRDRVHVCCPVASVLRREHHVRVITGDGLQADFDEVVFACHADQALTILQDPSRREREILSAFPYRSNTAVLHTDTKLLPSCRAAWASWNYHIPRGAEQTASVTYDLSRLQHHASATPILLTLNATDDIDEAKILRTFCYEHPAYSCESIAAQQRYREINGRRRTHFCGAYWGHGFHEDGVNSALAVAAHFGMEMNTCTVASIKDLSTTAVTSP